MAAGLADARDARSLYEAVAAHRLSRRFLRRSDRFEGISFDPVAWRPEYPNTAFDNMRADDAFWAARIVARFSDDAIRAVVAKARYSDPRASEYMTSTLIMRRDKVLRTWLAAVNPVVDVDAQRRPVS